MSTDIEVLEKIKIPIKAIFDQERNQEVIGSFLSLK